jgi:hypothetical protein
VFHQWSVEIDCEMTFHALVEYTGVIPNPVFLRMKKSGVFLNRKTPFSEFEGKQAGFGIHNL